jgi:hypothetical protein
MIKLTNEFSYKNSSAIACILVIFCWNFFLIKFNKLIINLGTEVYN